MQKIASVYISQQNLAKDFNETSDVVLLANLQAGVDTPSVDQALQSLAARYPAFTLYSFNAYRANIQQQSNAKLASLYFVVGALADVMTMEAKTVQGQSVRLKVSEAGMTEDKAKVIKTDLLAANGVIHLIDTVILPKS